MATNRLKLCRETARKNKKKPSKCFYIFIFSFNFTKTKLYVLFRNLTNSTQIGKTSYLKEKIYYSSVF